ncbi:hypothetical protein HDU82_005762 [Entophlyctis luteolus]|nr:hypothetical protein HDU82_005762 [Entophlyctis luteolus]
MASTVQVSQLMLNDGGLALLVQLADCLLSPSQHDDHPPETPVPDCPSLTPDHGAYADADDCEDLDVIDSEDPPPQKQQQQQQQQQGQDTGRDRVLSLRRDILSIDPDERHALASHALSAITNLMVRGRSRVRDALVEAGIVDVLVRFLEQLVTDMETLSAMQHQQQQQQMEIQQLQRQQCSSSSESSLSLGTSNMDLDVIAPNSSDILSSTATADFATIPVSVLDSVTNNRPQHQQLHQEEQPRQPEISSMISIPHAPTAAEPLQNPNHSAIAQAPAPSLHAHTEIPLLPGIRIRPAQTPAAAVLLNKIVAQQHNLLMCCKILHVVSKYPHLRHYMHIDLVRPVRPSVSDLCGAAIVAAAAANSSEASANAGLGISAPIPMAASSSTPPDSDSIRRNFDRFESSLFNATGVIPTQSAATFNQGENSSMSNQARTSQQISPVITTVPILVFDNEPESEIRLLESLAKLPQTIPSLPPVPAQSGAGMSAPQPRNHLIQTTLHYLPAPKNPRSAFELLEVFTTACSLVPEARTLTVATLRNAYRRDPVPIPAEGPHAPMGQAMGPCVYVDAEAYVKSSPSSRVIQGWRNGYTGPGVVVGLDCVTYEFHSKGCQRKAWVLHKNWCLKYTGDTTVTPAATAVPATQSSTGSFAVTGDPVVTAAAIDFAAPAPATIEDTTVLGTARQADATVAFQALGAMRRRASSSVGAGMVVAGGVHVGERTEAFMDETDGGNRGLF